MELLQGVTHLSHASIRIEREKWIIYLDPFKISGTPADADLVFCTHDHFDHLSPEDIEKVIKPSSILVVPDGCANKFKKMLKNNRLEKVIGVEPGKTYQAGDVPFDTVAAYNPEKKFHKKKEGWVGYILQLGQVRYYIAGDTDFTPEMKSVKADVAFLPVGGTYTMNALEAAEAANTIKPKIAIPIHFGSVVGSRTDAETFAKHLAPGIEARILLT